MDEKKLQDAGFSVSTTLGDQHLEMAPMVPPLQSDHLGGLLILLGYICLGGGFLALLFDHSMIELVPAGIVLWVFIWLARTLHHWWQTRRIAPVEITLRQGNLNTPDLTIALTDIKHITLKRRRGQTILWVTTLRDRFPVTGHVCHDAMVVLAEVVRDLASDARRVLREQGVDPDQVAYIPDTLLTIKKQIL